MLFRCVACQQSYEDRRFLWEKDVVTPVVEPLVEGEEPKHALASALQPTGSQLAVLKQSLDAGWEGKDKDCELASQADSTAAGSSLSSLSDWVSTADALEFPQPPKAQSQGFAMYGDLARAAGTSAKVAGCAGESGHLCGPLSLAGSAFGLAGGISQLHRGMTAPSGLKDPHLLTKGSVTTGIGSANVCLTAKATFCATACPHLFAAALCLSMANTAASSRIDSSMDGLCQACRDCCPTDLDKPERPVHSSFLSCFYR